MMLWTVRPVPPPRIALQSRHNAPPQQPTPSNLSHSPRIDILTTVLPSSHPTLQTLTILTDSLYLVKCLTEYVPIWERNGYRDSKGQYVENSEELADLASMVLHFERVGVRVAFWLVGSSASMFTLPQHPLILAGFSNVVS